MKKNLEKTDIYGIISVLILGIVLITLMLARAPDYIIFFGFILCPVYGIVVHLLIYRKVKKK